METLVILLVVFLVLALVGIPILAVAALAFVAAFLVFFLWMGVELFKVFICLIPTAIVGVAAAKIAQRLGANPRSAENIGLLATIPCLYYFFLA